MRPASGPWRALARLVLGLVAAAGPARPALAQPPGPAPDPALVLPAGSDVNDDTDTTDVGLLQVELGGAFTRTDAATRAVGTPLMLRYGAFEWLEVSAGTDGYLRQRTPDSGVVGGLGNLLVGARVRLFGAAGGLPVLAILPQLVIPTASAAKGLGSGAADLTVSAVSGADLGRRTHLDAGYGAGAIGGGDGAGRVAQQEAFVAASLSATAAWTPGVTLTWISRQDAATGRAVLASADSVFTVSRRTAVDVSAQLGLTAEAPAFEVAAGVSVVLGELTLDDTVHARRHRLRLRHKRRPLHPR